MMNIDEKDQQHVMLSEAKHLRCWHANRSATEMLRFAQHDNNCVQQIDRW